MPAPVVGAAPIAATAARSGLARLLGAFGLGVGSTLVLSDSTKNLIVLAGAVWVISKVRK